MSNKSSLSKALEGFKETYNLAGIELELSPLTGRHSGLFNVPEDKKETFAYDVVYNSLKESDSNITKEEVYKIPVGHISAMFKIVMKLTGFSEDEMEEAQQQAMSQNK